MFSVGTMPFFCETILRSIWRRMHPAAAQLGNSKTRNRQLAFRDQEETRLQEQKRNGRAVYPQAAWLQENSARKFILSRDSRASSSPGHLLIDNQQFHNATT